MVSNLTNTPDGYRVYLDVTKLDDVLLMKLVTQDVIYDSSRYVESLALSLGVTANLIANPTPYSVGRLAELFVYMTVCQLKSSFTNANKADNDAYALKYNMYRQLLKDCEKQITALTFTNGVQAKKRTFPCSMSMLRN